MHLLVTANPLNPFVPSEVEGFCRAQPRLYANGSRLRSNRPLDFARGERELFHD